MRSALVIFALTSLLMIGCDQTIDPPAVEPPDDLAVTAVLQPGKSAQHVLLSRVRPVDRAPGAGGYPYVQDARVHIGDITYRNLPADSLGPAPDVLEDGNYVSRAQTPAPGRSYELNIRQAGRRITGETTVPDTFRLKASGPFTLSWTESAGAALYEVVLLRVRDSIPRRPRENTTTETSLTLREDFEPPHRGQRRHPESHGPEAYVVTVQALNANMAAFRRAGDLELQIGVEGAYGLFGAVTTISDTVELGE